MHYTRLLIEFLGSIFSLSNIDCLLQNVLVCPYLQVIQKYFAKVLIHININTILMKCIFYIDNFVFFKSCNGKRFMEGNVFRNTI